MIIGNKVHLVAFDPEHWIFIRKWMGDPQYQFYFRNMPEMLNANQFMSFPQIMGMNVLMIVDTEADLVIGMATWDNVRVLARTCEIGFLIDKDAQGRGFTKDAFMHFMNYLFSRLGFHKVSAKIAKQEEGTANKSIWGGFTDRIILRDEFYMNGQWHDEVKLSVLDHEFRQRFLKFKEGETSWVEKAEVGKCPTKTTLGGQLSARSSIKSLHTIRIPQTCLDQEPNSVAPIPI